MEIWKKDYELVQLGFEVSTEASAWGLMPLMKKVLQQDHGHLRSVSGSGSIEKDISFYLDKINSLNYRLLSKSESEYYHEYLWINPDSIFQINYSVTAGTLSFKGYSLNDQAICELEKFIDDTYLPNVQQGHIFAVVQQGNSLSLSSIGEAGIPLNRCNYSDKVIKDYDYVVEDLNSETPAGRLVILEGKAGTGKTHMIKALAMEVPDAMFVLMSPDMLMSLDGPQLLPLLLTNKRSYCPDGPIILIVEDADKCLVTRASDNMSSIQSLLNLTDGILGTLLDLRVIATTNASKLDMEPAILRSGRLSKRIEVGPLNLKEANRLFQHLLPEVSPPEMLMPAAYNAVSHVTLADVYAIARENGWKPQSRNKSRKNDLQNVATNPLDAIFMGEKAVN